MPLTPSILLKAASARELERKENGPVGGEGLLAEEFSRLDEKKLGEQPDSL